MKSMYLADLPKSKDSLIDEEVARQAWKIQALSKKVDAEVR